MKNSGSNGILEFALIYDEINQLLLVNVLRARVIPVRWFLLSANLNAQKPRSLYQFQFSSPESARAWCEWTMWLLLQGNLTHFPKFHLNIWNRRNCLSESAKVWKVSNFFIKGKRVLKTLYTQPLILWDISNNVTITFLTYSIWHTWYWRRHMALARI